jgi:hypothetical protein
MAMPLTVQLDGRQIWQRIDARRVTIGLKPKVEVLTGQRRAEQEFLAANGTCSSDETHFPAVAQTVGFGSGRLKMLYFSMGID